MDNNLQYGKQARIVGYVDLVVSAFVVVFYAVLICFFLLTYDTITKDPDYAHKATELVWGIWIPSGVTATLGALQILAATKLIQATKLSEDFKRARSGSMFWRNVTILNIIATVTMAVVLIVMEGSDINPIYFGRFVVPVFRVGFLHMGSKFISEVGEYHELSG